MESTKRPRLVVVAMIAGCGGSVPATPLAWVEAGDAPAPAVAVSSYALLERQVATSVETVDKLTEQIVASDSFRCVLSQIDAIAAEGKTGPISGKRVLLMYSSSLGDYRRLPVCYAYKKGGGSETARTGAGTSTSECNRGGIAVANITLRQITLERINGTSIEERACAINTLAHEKAHGVVNRDHDTIMVFTDDGHDEQPNPVVSYVIGAVAQCVFLRGQYSSQPFDTRGCIEAVGTNALKPGVCAPDWSKQFLRSSVLGGCE